MRSTFLFAVTALMALLVSSPAEAQLLKKLEQRLNNVINNAAPPADGEPTPAVAPGYLGLTADNTEGDQGVVVLSTKPGSPAEAAGFKKGDLITAINREAIKNLDDFSKSLDAVAAGERAQFTVERGREGLTLNATLVARQAPPVNRLGAEDPGPPPGSEVPRFVLMEIPSGANDALPHGAVLAECLPGRAAVVMAPQVATTGSSLDRETIERALLLALEDALREQHVVLAQALTTSRVSPTTHAFLSAGYRIAGDLLYLTADLTEPRDIPAPGAPCALELVCHSPDDSARWIPLIDHTYVKTLDCPAVDGLRATSDVLAGYRDIGRPRDDWWFIARHEGQDVGCLILADHHPAHHAELVYMGLIPEIRGRGWGVVLAREAQSIAAQSAAQQLVLSVDAANTHAICHYQAAGFQLWEQRTILIKPL